MRVLHPILRTFAIPVFAGLVWLCGVAGLRAEPVDRDVAEWAIRMGGWVDLHGRDGRIHSVENLPTEDFRLETLNLVGGNIDPPDLARLSTLSALKELHLRGPCGTPARERTKNQSTDLKFIAPLSTLETLTFSYTFLASIRFIDDGFEQIESLTNLKNIRVRQTRVKGHALGPFRNLESLDLTFTPVDDEGVANLVGMRKLRRLWLGDTLVTDKGLEALENLTELEELDLGGTGITDNGLTYLSGLTKLKKLNLLGADIADAGLDHLAKLTNLQVLNLYRSKVTNAGLEKLKALTKLREVDLRYSRATGSGVDALRAALPEARLVFLDFSLQAADEHKAMAAPRDSSDAATAEWVLSLGGTATVESGVSARSRLHRHRSPTPTSNISPISRVSGNWICRSRKSETWALASWENSQR